ncbi:MAG: hypothetical protein DSY38_00935 [Fusobacteria bacterium]|nr:MAG: hypothetical protein DSY38_00935 [Fusobacteriota bacterium]
MSIYKRLLTIGLVIVALTSCGSKEEEVKQEQLRTVRHETVEFKSGVEALSFTGDIRSEKEPEVSFRVSGNIQKMNFKLGESVKKGDILATIDKTDYEIKLRQAESRYETAKASKIEAESSYDRIKELYQNDSVSKSEFESAKARMDSAMANLKAAEEGVKYAKRILNYTTLRSSIKGTVAVKIAEVNENVAVGQPVYILNTSENLEAVSFIPESAIGKIKVGAKVDITVDALNRSYEGKVIEVGTSSANYGSTFPVKVAILGDTQGLRSGMSVVVKFNENKLGEKNKIFVPLNVILIDKDSHYVFIVEKTGEEEGTVRKVPVQVGEISNDGIEILEGLNQGDEIITAGMTKLEDGMKVQYN